MTQVNENPPLFLLDDFTFPDPFLDYEDGFVGASYDLHPKRLLEGYSKGFFPWYQDTDKMFHWFMLDERMMIPTKKIKSTKRLRQKLRSSKWDFKINTNFKEVINQCASVKRKDDLGTWISDEFKNSYTQLNELGFALSVESYYENKLVGGFYGVAIGKYFSGESMFFKKSDASKLALLYFAEILKDNEIEWIDCQVPNPHLESMGGIRIPKKKFIPLIDELVKG